MLSLRTECAVPAAEPPAAAGLPALAAAPRLPARLLPAALAPVLPHRPERRRRVLHVLSFALVVAVPAMIAAIYLFAIAADQYVSEFRFTLRTVAPSAIAPGWLLGAAAAPSEAGSDSRILVQYVTSRAAVDDLDRTLDLRRLYTAPAADWWARLHRPAPIERLVAYWRGQIDAYYDPADATVVIRVRAFSPQDALGVARAVAAACQRLVNDLSARMRQDALGQADAAVDAARTRLAGVLAQIGAFRRREGLLDPGKTATESAALAARLQDELVQADTRLATLRAYMRADAPAVAVTKARIRSLEAQRRALAQAVTSPDHPAGEALSSAIGSFEALENQRRFAEDSYRHALADLDRARADVDRQHVYIASFVPPSLAQEALYPRRWRTLGIVALGAFALWAIGGLTLQSIRDHI